MSELQFGIIVKKYREEKKLTQQVLGDRIGLSGGEVRSMEGGKFFPGINSLLLLCKELQLDYKETLEGVLEEEKNAALKKEGIPKSAVRPVKKSLPEVLVSMREDTGIKQEEFWKGIVKKDEIKAVESGEMVPSSKSLIKLAERHAWDDRKLRAYRIYDEIRLKGEEGVAGLREMFGGEQEDCLSPDEKQVLAFYRGASEVQKDVILGFISKLTS